MKRVFGTIEFLFNSCYMAVALILGFMLLASASANEVRLLAGIMALVLVGGDAFHLLPRIMLVRSGKEQQLQRKLGRGKQVTSITMTLFYLLLWHIGVLSYSPDAISIWTYGVYALAFIRIVLCLMPQNRWEERYPPIRWGIARNIPFFLQGMIVAILFFSNRGVVSAFEYMWLAIVLSFVFYLPVVLWVNKNPKLGMLMIPKTFSYLWMLGMCMEL